MFRSARVLFLVCGLGGVVSCAAPQKTPRGQAAFPAPPSDPWAWLPEQSAMLGQLVFARFRGTPALAAMEEASRHPRALGNVVELDKVERAIFALVPNHFGSVVMALSGPFGPTYLAERAKDKLVPGKHGLLTFQHAGTEAFVQIHSELIVICSNELINATAARATAGPASDVRRSALFRSLGERIDVDGSDFTLIVDDRNGEFSARVQRRAARYGLPLTLDGVVRAALSLDIETDGRLTLVVETTGSGTAQGLADMLNSSLSSLGSDPWVDPGLRPVATALTASRADSYVVARGTLTQADLGVALERAAIIFNFAATPGSGAR